MYSQCGRVPVRVIYGWLILLLYKAALTCSMIYYLCDLYREVFPKDFDAFRMLLGFLWCSVAYFSIQPSSSKPNSFFLYLLLWLLMAPLSVVYTVCGGSLAFFNICFIGFLLCIFIVQKTKPFPKIANTFISNKSIIILCTAVSVLILVHLYIKNGLPSLVALDIYAVYEIRTNGMFQINKYVKYLLDMFMVALMPFLITHSIIECNIVKRKKYSNLFLCLFILGCVGIFYLYSGNKVYIFSIGLILSCIFVSKRTNFISEFLTILSVALSSLCFYVILVKHNTVLHKVYMLICRRALLLPARISFTYSDYFSANPRYGIHGILPTFLVPTHSPYPDDFVIGKVISEVYFNNHSNSSTGMLGDAFMRSGFVSILFAWIILAIIMKLLDSLQERTSYRLVIGSFSFFIYYLVDGPFIGDLFFGPPMAVILLAVLYGRNMKRTSLFVSDKQDFNCLCGMENTRNVCVTCKKVNT